MTTQHVWRVFRYEVVRNFKRRGFLFTTFGIPLLAIGLFLGAQVIQDLSQSGDDDEATLEFELRSIEQAGYVDASGFFEEPGALAADVLVSYPDESSAQEAMDAGDIDIYYLIPEDYPETGEVTLISPSFTLGLISEAPIQQLFFSQLMEQGISETDLLRLLNPAQISSSVVTFGENGEETDVTDGDEAQNNEPLVVTFALIFIFSLFSTNTYLMQTLIEEKETRLIEILISSMRPIELLLGKVLALGVLGIFQVGVYIGAVVLVTTITGESGPLGSIQLSADLLIVAIVYYILGYFLFAMMFGMVGAVSTSLTEGPSISAVFILPALLPWIFWAVYVESPESPLVTILSFVPITSPLGMVMRSAVTDVTLIEYAISVALLIGTTFGVLWLAGRLFRVQILLSGTVPKIREIPGLIFGTD